MFFWSGIWSRRHAQEKERFAIRFKTASLQDRKIKSDFFVFVLASCFFYLIFAPLTRGGVYIMLIIPIKDGENIDRALKRYKRKFDKTGTVRQLRARQAFIKPSVTNRMKIQKAAYIQNMKDSLES
jgi:small subunit ribosomal protein S21